MENKFFLEARDVIKIYISDYNKNAKIVALRGIELFSKLGEIISIVGPSGSGKSTFIKLLGGLEEVSSGIINIDGEIISNYNRNELTNFRRNNIGFLWQYSERNLLNNLTVEKNVLLPMRLSHKYSFEERKKRSKFLLNKVDLSSKSSSLPHRLSGGEAQRIALAVALANDPKLILADEPTGELDNQSAEMVIEFIKELNKEFEKTFILVTHDEKIHSKTMISYKIRYGTISEISKAVNIDQFVISPQKEIFGYIDQYGNVKIPEYIIKELKFKSYVKIILNGEKKCVEIFPIDFIKN